MPEDRWSTVDDTRLHVYARSEEHVHAKTEDYTLPGPKRSEKRPFRITTNKIVKKPWTRRRKFPGKAREHTEFGRSPHLTTCPNCLSYVRTKVYHYNTRVTHAVAASLTLVCLCFIPYKCKRYKNTAHYCPVCNIFLGTKFGAGRKICFCFA